LEDENDDSHLEFFYTSLESSSQPISTIIESRMKEDCGRRHSKTLLDSYEIIVGQVLNVRCACHSRHARKLFNKI
jgi:hypothetical protein